MNKNNNLKNTSQINRTGMSKNMNRNTVQNNKKSNLKNSVTTVTQSKGNREKGNVDVVLKGLWRDNIIWTRFFIISAISGIGDLQIITKRLIKNPTDFANVLKKYYGEENSKKFEAFMMDHLLIGIKLINTAKSGNIKAIKALKMQWYKNADEIAEFMSSINPNWKFNEWQKMFYEVLKLTEDQVIKRFGHQYNEDMSSFEKIDSLSVKMAEFMAEGITKQTK